MTITRVARVLLDEKEFKKYKKYPPFEGVRQLSKSVNFSFLFGAAPHTFMRNVLEPMWTKEQASEFVETNKLQDLREEIVNFLTLKGKDVNYETIDYLTPATYIRNSFFEMYKGLEHRINRNTKIITEQGYTRTYHGVIRRLPLMMLKGKDDNFKDIAGYINIGANSEIQSLEVCKIMPALVRISKWFRRMGLKSRVWGMIHDSVDFYLYKPELEIVIPKIYEMFEKTEEWQKGIPLTVEFHIADPVKGEIYHSGTEAWDILKEHEATN